MSLVFRRPDRDEAEDFARVHIACWREAYATIVPKAILDATDIDERTDRWRILLGDESRLVTGAYVEGEPAGFINAGKPQEILFAGEDGHVAALYVLEKHYRRGIGRSLLGNASAWWMAQGGTSLAVAALARNSKARSFYEALGGELVREGIFVWHGFELPDVVYNFTNLTELAEAAR